MSDRGSLVSVLTPVWNAARFLDETVASVVAQTHGDWELLLADDGSTDESAEVAARWAEREPERIRFLAHPGRANLGTSATRNLALAHARGSYIALLDADDVWLPDHLEQQLAALRRHPSAGWIYGPTEEWFSWSGAPEDVGRDAVPALGVPRERPLAAPGPLAHWVRRAAPTPCTCSVVLRREAVQAVGGFEADFRGMYDDQVLYAKLCLSGSVVAGEACTSRYRRHPDSCYSTAKATGRATADRVAYLDWLGRYLAERRAADGELRRLVDRERQAAEGSSGTLIGRLRRLRRR